MNASQCKRCAHQRTTLEGLEKGRDEVDANLLRDIQSESFYTPAQGRMPWG